METINNKLPSRSVMVFLNFMIVFAGLVAVLMVYYIASYPLLKSFVYNSDALYLSSLYVDVLNGTNLSQWSLPPTPYIFPDMFLYFLLRTVTSNIHSAIVVFGMTQYLVFALGLSVLAKQTMPHSYGLARYSLVALMGVFFLVFISKLESFSQLIFVSAFHFGIVLCIPFVLIILCKLVTESHLKAVYLGALCILSFVISASDGLYLVQVAVPLIGSLGMLFLMKKIDARRAVIVSGALLIASIAGLALVSISVSKNEMVEDYLFRPHLIAFSFSQLLKSFASILFFEPAHAILAAVFLFICAFRIIKLLTQSLRGKKVVTNSTDILITSYFLLSFVCNVLAIICLGAFIDRNGLRYFLPLLIFSGFWGIPFVLEISPTAKTVLLERCVLGVLSLTVLFAVRNVKPQQVVHVFTDAYYPADTKCIDENAAQLGISHGIAQYWQAKPLSLLTQNKLIVVQVTRDLSPYYWINNLAWYDIEPEFAIIDLSLPEGDHFRLDEDFITKRFGKPDDIFLCGSSRVLVYLRPDSGFRTIFKNVLSE